MTPGSTCRPLASKTSAALAYEREPMAAMRPAMTPTSAGAMPLGVATTPPRIKRSKLSFMAKAVSPATRPWQPLAVALIEGDGSGISRRPRRYRHFGAWSAGFSARPGHQRHFEWSGAWKRFVYSPALAPGQNPVRFPGDRRRRRAAAGCGAGLERGAAQEAQNVQAARRS